MDRNKFSEFILKLKRLIKENKHQIALDFIDALINNAFLTMEQINIVNKFKRDITIEFQATSLDDKLSKLDQQQFIKWLKANDFNYTNFDTYFKKFILNSNDKLNQDEYELILSWLHDRNLTNYDKKYILDSLCESKIYSSLILSVFNTSLNKYLDLDLKKWKSNFKKHYFYGNLYKQINKLCMKEPSKVLMLSELIQELYVIYLGEKFINWNASDIVNKIIKYTLLGISKLNEKDIPIEDISFVKLLLNLKLF